MGKRKKPVNCGVFVGSAVFTPRGRVTDNLATRTMHVWTTDCPIHSQDSFRGQHLSADNWLLLSAPRINADKGFKTRTTYSNLKRDLPKQPAALGLGSYRASSIKFQLFSLASATDAAPRCSQNFCAARAFLSTGAAMATHFATDEREK